MGLNYTLWCVLDLNSFFMDVDRSDSGFFWNNIIFGVFKISGNHPV